MQQKEARDFISIFISIFFVYFSWIDLTRSLLSLLLINRTHFDSIWIVFIIFVSHFILLSFCAVLIRLHISYTHTHTSYRSYLINCGRFVWFLFTVATHIEHMLFHFECSNDNFPRHDYYFDNWTLTFFDNNGEREKTVFRSFSKETHVYLYSEKSSVQNDDRDENTHSVEWQSIEYEWKTKSQPKWRTLTNDKRHKIILEIIKCDGLLTNHYSESSMRSLVAIKQQVRQHFFVFIGMLLFFLPFYFYFGNQRNNILYTCRACNSNRMKLESVFLNSLFIALRLWKLRFFTIFFNFKLTEKCVKLVWCCCFWCIHFDVRRVRGRL